MITKIHITDREKSAIQYIKDLPGFENGKDFNFSPGINILVGENGSGKSTLINLIRKYMCIEGRECDLSNISHYSNLYERDVLQDGVDIYGDWSKNVFRLEFVEEMRLQGHSLMSFDNFGMTYEGMNSSTGQGTIIALNSLFNYMFSPEANLNFPIKERYSRLENDFKDYLEYIDNHTVDCESRYTLLLDEPDRNLDIFNLDSIADVFTYKRDDIQIITSIQNPLLISKLSEYDYINFIELSPNYVDKVKNKLNSFLKK